MRFPCGEGRRHQTLVRMAGPPPSETRGDKRSASAQPRPRESARALKSDCETKSESPGPRTGLRSENGGSAPAASSMWAVPGRKPCASPAMSGSERLAASTRQAIVVRLGIPRFLVEAVLEGDSHPTPPHPSEDGDRRSWAILEPVDTQKPLWIDRFRTIRVVLAGEVEAHRSSPSPPRSGPRDRGGRMGTGVTVRPRSGFHADSRALISRAQRSASLSPLQ